MAGARSTNTFSEGLQRLIADFAVMMTMPDADIEWVANMQAQCVDKARQPIANMQQAGATSMQGPPGGGMPGMPMPPAQGPMPMPPGMPMPAPPMPGAMPGAPDPSMAAVGAPGGGMDMNIAVPPGANPRGVGQDAAGMDDEMRRLLGG